MADENTRYHPGELYFSRHGVEIGLPDGSAEILSYGKKKVDELLDKKADKIDLEKYITSKDAEGNFIKVTEILTTESLEAVVKAVKPLEGKILEDNGVDIALQDHETFTVVAQNENRVSIGTKGNMRFIPAANTEGFFTDGINCIDPVTDQAVEAIGFHGRMKRDTNNTVKPMSLAPDPSSDAITENEEPQMEVDYIYIGFHNGEPSTRVTPDGHFHIGDVDVLEKLKELEDSSGSSKNVQWSEI